MPSIPLSLLRPSPIHSLIHLFYMRPLACVTSCIFDSSRFTTFSGIIVEPPSSLSTPLSSPSPSPPPDDVPSLLRRLTSLGYRPPVDRLPYSHFVDDLSAVPIRLTNGRVDDVNKVVVFKTGFKPPPAPPVFSDFNAGGISSIAIHADGSIHIVRPIPGDSVIVFHEKLGFRFKTASSSTYFAVDDFRPRDSRFSLI